MAKVWFGSPFKKSSVGGYWGIITQFMLTFFSEKFIIKVKKKSDIAEECTMKCI